MRLWSLKIVYNSVFRQSLKFQSVLLSNVQECQRRSKVWLENVLVFSSVSLHVLCGFLSSNLCMRFLAYIQLYLGCKLMGTLPKDHHKSTWEGPNLWIKAAQGSRIYTWKEHVRVVDLFCKGHILPRHRGQSVDSTVTKFTFKIHVRTALHRVVSSRWKKRKLMLSLTLLKGSISEGVFWVFCILVIGGYSAFLNINSPFKSKSSSPKQNLPINSFQKPIDEALKLKARRNIFQVFIHKFIGWFFITKVFFFILESSLI